MIYKCVCQKYERIKVLKGVSSMHFEALLSIQILFSLSLFFFNLFETLGFVIATCTFAVLFPSFCPTVRYYCLQDSSKRTTCGQQ
ncbi:hypothetical protein XELAEV_18012446mg [Xenopus laevis]|uniref:Uncharacterized protein n=1 Tax=Xenopus laevis TaxID=8355 RepID=A0A974HYP7_XENLA|nr:hypothetical protein XELAEV_18012446mg [Xenopus laevis]